MMKSGAVAGFASAVSFGTWLTPAAILASGLWRLPIGAALFDLDRATQEAAAELGQGAGAVVQLTGVYHNLLRRWADA